MGTDLTLIADKDTYKVGDTPTFTVISKNDCFLTLTNIDSKGGEGTVIFPNKFQQDNKIKAKVEIKLPGASAPFRYRMQDPGTEEVIAVCTEAKVVVDGIKQDFKKEDFTAVNNYTRSVANSLSRKIAVESAAPGAKVAVAKVVAPAKGREISRAAIKISVQ
ncbi:MAG: DUF4384 domain-containing protein [Proteobacteria bacterium]|nr:DUF4384 domain-containing protein [Pseudomonadota bacterium]